MWGIKPYKPAIPLQVTGSNRVTASLYSMYKRAATHPYVMPNQKFTGSIPNQPERNARPIIAKLPFFNFRSTNNGKKSG